MVLDENEIFPTEIKQISSKTYFSCVSCREFDSFSNGSILELSTAHFEVGVNLVPGNKPSHSDRGVRGDGRRIHISSLASCL